VILAAGLKGIEEGYKLPPRPTPTSSSSPTRSVPRIDSARYRSPCPKPLAAMEQSELVAESLGEHIFEWLLRNKRSE
jgi:glutamine synthetase